MFFPAYLFVLVAIAHITGRFPAVEMSAHPILSKGEAVIDASPTPWPGQRSMLSIYVDPDNDQGQRTLEVRGKLDRGLNNLEDRIVVVGVVDQDVVSGSGSIIISAGSKVVGLGFCDAGRARIEARGKWTFYVSDHQISLEGSLWGADRKEGLSGIEVENGIDPTRVKQAICRDGIYVYVPEATEFVLRLSGNISVRDLGSAFGK